MKANQIFTNKTMVAIFAIVSCLFWGSAFPAVKVGYSMFNISAENTWLKISFAGYRFFIASLMIILYALLSKQKLSFKPGHIKHFIGLGLISTTFQYIFFYIGLSHSTGVKSSILIFAGIFFTIIIAHFLFQNDKINKNKIIGLTLGIIGVFMINFSFELLKSDFTFLGEGFIILSQLMGALSAIYVKKLGHSIPITMLTAYQMLTGSILLIIPSSLKVGLFPFHLNPANRTLYLYLSLISAVAFTLWNTIIKYNPVGQVTIYQFFIPIFGVILSAIFLKGEHITITTLIALILVSIGIVIVYRPDKNAKIDQASETQT